MWRRAVLSKSCTRQSTRTRGFVVCTRQYARILTISGEDRWAVETMYANDNCTSAEILVREPPRRRGAVVPSVAASCIEEHPLEKRRARCRHSYEEELNYAEDQLRMVLLFLVVWKLRWCV